ncbi:MAG: sigma-70 family RNA polymerase sigma factor [Gemmatimonadota bacterium]|jgi:RNA polymerase sigma-70 factor (ECF subfamily)|nr:sigma-70 family RNA polymerase sigma factor [Gemmatimonadota bacterium]MDP6802078.1 sigma-70 family RNA polymerase sigma factor [Gemmatimonadota bacterium]MDP7032458.1 sigma-70 family RNA polymerase sigma factor [Gemmatimonadota bacterium]
MTLAFKRVRVDANEVTVETRRPDEDLMLDLKEGDESAFGELMCRHRGRIVNFLIRLIGDADRAEDLAQEVFLRVYRHAGTYRVTARFTTWLYTIASNLGKNELRNRARRRNVSIEDTPRELGQADYDFGTREDFFAPDRIADLNERRQAVRSAIDSLPGHFRIMLVMRDLEGFTYEEISTMLKLPVGTVKSRINRARQEFKRRIEPLLFATRGNDPTVFWKASRVRTAGSPRPERGDIT